MQIKVLIFKNTNNWNVFFEEHCHLSKIRQEERSFRRRLTENPCGINEIGFRQ